MLEPVVRCNARVSMLAALVQLDACRLRLGSVLRSQRSTQHAARNTQHAEQARLGRRGGTAVMKDLVGRHTAETCPGAWSTASCSQPVRAARQAAEVPGRWQLWDGTCVLAGAPCSESSADSQTARQATAASLRGPGED
jgi:hypothetical protein